MKNQKPQSYTTKEYIILAIFISAFILTDVIFFENNSIIISAIMPVLGYLIGLGIIKLTRKNKS